ncbi:hypothetical protein NAF17_02290 [Mucilaginibacter sp. RB4R14]|uniref:hypothetical protein n=1 Tax=Mucilaginibacter aurantiaciroseus TaxID=2949308 RepID=UPI00209168A4|nr:hypothetical protein [Mucilaginibacter aurantiaciroseus]MCO5934356.1 hypothetical protein [Mucilaginibacter aurantiaciroseus]
MKKPVLILFGLLLLAIISIYFVIPQKIKTTNVIDIDATDINVSKFLVNKKAWVKWWPGQHNAIDSSNYNLKGVIYILKESTNSEMKAIIKFDDIKLNTQLIYATTGEDICEVTWFTEMQSSLNPYTRVADFIKIKRITKDIDGILKSFKKFMQTDVNVYGMPIKISQIKNPIVLALTTNTPNYPTPEVIYNLVGELKKQINEQNARGLDSPMLNIHVNETKGYQIMIAIPINKVIMPGKNMAINNLVKNGNQLETNVKGGKNVILNAYAQLKNYQTAHRLISPAMPYESLITNRFTEKDTAKWVTKIFWPIF